MNILITGHKGFIGQNMMTFLKSKGHDVTGFEYYDNDDHFPNLKGMHTVIHLGAETDTTCSDIKHILERNYDFSKRLYDECQDKHIMLQYASSASVYGHNKNSTEDGAKEPLNYYATSKYLFDRYVESQSPISRVQGFRYFNVYGPHEDHKKDQASPISKFFHEAVWKHEIDIFEGSENFKRDFVFVGDICELHYRMLDVNESGIWNAGTGVATSFEEIAIMIAEKYESNVNRIPMPDNLKNQYQEYTKANLNKLNSTVKMNWFPVEDYINYEL
ncbi:MAG: hypothetical protein CBB96_05630 [Gammaproteobacteria bacterium TMED36]|nr:MAG: hypothetical protein CBB96_08850 [Gammaproteobacteria bacterium TMED36]OUT94644.1 MAG: hypothetical protein CBB96_05630 [Gammaproteobacteria bacterium TMED36]